MVAGVLFVLPGMAALLVLSALYVGLGDTAVVSALFTGLGAAVVAIVVQALVRVAGRALTHPLLVGVAVAAFVALTVFGVPFPIVIAAAAGLGWLAARRIPAITGAGSHGAKRSGEAPALVADDALHAETARRRHGPSGRSGWESSSGPSRSPPPRCSPGRGASTPARGCSSPAPRW